MSEAGVLPRIEAFEDGASLAEAGAALITEQLAAALRNGARARLVATGGSTPAPTYRRLAQAQIDWSRVDVTLSDERWVPPTSPDSNERLVRETLLQGPAAAAAFTPLWSPSPDLNTTALAAEAGLRPLLPFDLVLLGMGEDGHIASLFPASPVLAQGRDPDGERLCIGAPAGAPAPSQPRISLTVRALLQTRLVLLLVTGEAKRRVIDAALGGEDLPVRSVLAQDRAPVRILWAP
ncbi:MAG: 6-phosphogluconolactonase [Phenylobacterium sp.]